jgi:hypothetical protein
MGRLPVLLAVGAAMLMCAPGASAKHRRASKATAAPVQAFTITVGSDVRISTVDLATVESDIEHQSAALRMYWGTPLARFTPSGGWPVDITNNATSVGDEMGANGSAGFHGELAGLPYAVIGTGTTPREWAYILSHEVMEMLEDPTGAGLEVCDPAPHWGYDGGHGWDMAMFVEPEFFRRHAKNDPYQDIYPLGDWERQANTWP